MKKILIFSIIFIAIKISAQGNLQFNQVVIVYDIPQTVPSGKVWKVESYLQQQVNISTNFPTTGCSDLSRPRPYFIDNYSYHNIEGIGNGNSNNSSTAKNNFPIWLKSGQVVKTSCAGDFLSIIEFNIVP
ncbi:MAG: hypothetical protein ACK5D5_00390 [Bacteroidota bacterium]|jgi:hypothetical protein